MKLLFLNDEGIREFTLTRKKIILGIVALLILGAGFSYLTIDVLTKKMYQAKINNLKQNNERLIGLLDNLQSTVQTMEQELTTLQSRDEEIRTYADLPAVDSDVRKLGIGGTRYDKTMELDYLLPTDETKVSDLVIDVERLSRMLKLERLSYEKLYDTFKHNTAKIQSTPSIRPIEGGYFTDGFGYRRDPFTHQRRFHYGLDISARRGTPIHATAGGTVKYAKRRSGYGLVVALDHGYGYETMYAHMSKMHAKPGQKVERGDLIGEVGNTGRSTASHLHYEILVGGNPVNPINYFFSGYLNN
ncbi:MAG: M23 family metallopeptidase [Candidatus Marinimicrobia bacterium]|nr:M23 family metallopeptidase [Candidatus Neomarinimicrobiota bacterium]MCF7828934.1 M23 family metallopeptidase [Candidatus Neomarinimicrobiota bacterium]MCF7879894.1 M23 family metallopeptidase [Candidatus Neomarinimicrobiota bacterium]